MIFNIILLATLTIWSSIKCEPPVNSYLPPNNGASRPSPQYGPPGSRNGGSRSGRPQFGGGDNGNSQESYTPPEQFGRQNPLDTQYGPPPQQSLRQGTGQSQSPSQRSSNQGRGGSIPSSQYGPPNPSNNRGLAGLSSPSDGSFDGNSDNGLGSFGGSGQRPQTSYGPPPTGPAQSNSGFSTQGQESNQRSAPSGVPDTSYGTPGFGTSNDSRNRQSFGGSPSSTYGTPDFSSNGRQGAGNSGFDGESDEPAKYEFSYDVDDAQTGTKFGHSEQRDGDLATGEYNVVLPDGRKQVVEYEAGLQGYKPQIRYEGEADRGNGAGSQFGGQAQGEGYPRGGPQTSNFQNNNNGNGFHQPGQAGNGNGYQKGPRPQQDGANGYSRREPDNGHNGERSRNGFGSPQGGIDSSNGYSSGGQSNFGFGRNGLPSGDSQLTGYQGRGSQGGEEGYSSGGSQNGARGYSEGKKQGNSGGFGSQLEGSSQGGFGGEEGYPSGRPNGSRGTGY